MNEKKCYTDATTYSTCSQPINEMYCKWHFICPFWYLVSISCGHVDSECPKPTCHPLNTDTGTP